MSKKHVFLSYCHDDAAAAQKLHDDLEAAGETVWWDQEILGAQDWKMEIRKALRESYAVVLCLSQNAEARATAGIFPEAYDAIEYYRNYQPGSAFLFPVRLSDCDIPLIEIDATRTLDRLQYIDLFPATNYAEGLNKLRQSLRKAPLRP